MPLTTVLLDLDGVVRHFDVAHVAAVEERHGLPSGILHTTAFEPERLERLVTVRLRRADWIDEVGAQVGHLPAARECFADQGRADESLLAVVDGLDVDPVEVFFTDDSASKLRGAIEIGMTARLFEGVEVFRQHLVEVELRRP